MLEYENQPAPAQPENPTAVASTEADQAALGAYFTATERQRGYEGTIRCGPTRLEFAADQQDTASAVTDLMSGVAQRNGMGVGISMISRQENGDKIPVIAFLTGDSRASNSEIARRGAAVASATNASLEALGSPMRLPDLQ